jgi:hypothetical protein
MPGESREWGRRHLVDEMVKREPLTQAAEAGASVILRTVGLVKGFGAMTAMYGTFSID